MLGLALVCYLRLLDTTQGKQWAIARLLLPFHAVVATYSSGCITHTVLVLVKFQLSFPSHQGILLF